MRLIRRQDTPLVIALLSGTAVAFWQPLRFVLSVAEDVSTTYGVDLVPGFVIFSFSLVFHHWRTHRDVVAAVDFETREAEKAKKTAADLEQIVVASHAIAGAVDAEALRVEMWRQIPPFVNHRRCWLAATTPDGWRWLIEPSEESNPDALLDTAQSLTHDAQSVEHRHNEWLIVPLRIRGERVGLLAVDETTALSVSEKSRLVTLATAVAIGLKNAQLFSAMQTTSVSDALTGCFNRAHALQSLDHEMRRARRSRSPLSVAMVDLDDFKLVNDQYGHVTGDRLLEAVGTTLRQTLRATDIKCRYGGDEFLIILPDTHFEASCTVAEHLRRAFGNIEVLLPSGTPIRCDISVGVAGWAASDEMDPLALIQRADEALYRNKARHGRRDRRVEPLSSESTVGVPAMSA